MNCVKSSTAQSDGAWLFDICKLSEALVVSTSTNNLIIYDPETLVPQNVITKAHDDIITGVIPSKESSIFYSSSRDGTVKCWDPRTRKAVRTHRATAGILSMSHHSIRDKLAIGTELKGTDAVVSVYDSRSSNPLVSYTDSHAEDITSLSWHSSNNLLLSGGGDGIINVFDTTIIDEDDAVLQVFNHGSSIHVAQFIDKNEVLAMSHMETASLYKLSYNQEDVPRDEIKEYGDLRPKLAIDYAISFDSGNAEQAMLFAGSNSGSLSLIPFSTTSMEFQPDLRLDMESGSEVIRSVYYDYATDSLSGPLLYAASEDGILRVFSKQSPDMDEVRIARKKERRESKSAKKRFEPY